MSRHGRPKPAAVERSDQFEEFIGAEREAAVGIGLPHEAQRMRRSLLGHRFAIGGASVRVAASWLAARPSAGPALLRHAAGRLAARLADPVVGSAGSERIRRRGAHRLPRKRRTARTRRALRRIGRVARAPGAGEGAARGAAARALVAAGAATTGSAAIALARRAQRLGGDDQHAMTAIGKIDPRTAAGREHAGRCAKAAQPLHARLRRRRFNSAGELRDLAPVRIGGPKIFSASRAVAGAEHARAGRGWPTECACRRPTTAMPAGCSSHAPRAADRVALASSNSASFVELEWLALVVVCRRRGSEN